MPAFDFPQTGPAAEARAFLEETSPAFLVNHCLRSYLFGRAVAAGRGLRPGADYDDELLFVSCALHDLGLTEAGRGGQRFEVDGADLAVRFLRERGVDAGRADIVWEAIALHTSLGIANRRRPEVALAHAGIGVDVTGRGADTLPPGLAEEVHGALPRLGLAEALTGAVVARSAADPATAPPMTFPGELLRQRVPGAGLPTWDRMLAASPWHDPG